MPVLAIGSVFGPSFGQTRCVTRVMRHAFRVFFSSFLFWLKSAGLCQFRIPCADVIRGWTEQGKN